MNQAPNDGALRCPKRAKLTTQTPIKLTFLVRSLDYGGAQRQLITLVKGLDKNRFRVCVMAFYPGPLEQELAGSDVQVITLDKGSRWDILGFLRRLTYQVRLARPDVLHGYLDIPNLLALFLKLFVRARVVWGLRASTIELEHYDWLHRLASKLEKGLSGWADLIIVNSSLGLERHVARGFPRQKTLMIPNGFDTELFKPDRKAGEQLRGAWGVPQPAKLVGIVGRLDPMKDHQNFLRAAALVCRRADDASSALGSHDTHAVRFVCLGDGPADYRNGLKILASDLGLTNKLIWQDATTDVSAVYNALDVLVSSSRAEGLPNVVGEAMACGLPCVVSDVGDSRWLIGECGVVVPSQNPAALAEGIIRCLADDRDELGRKARARIIENFSTQKLATLTEQAIVSLAGSRQQ